MSEVNNLTFKYCYYGKNPQINSTRENPLNPNSQDGHRRSHYRSRRETSVELLKRRQIPESELWAITCKPQRKDIKG
ncbi:hypothetical protein L3X38_021765 [Prunus dulcis]|uniref:Uncharacterized protein n=1 Tax=Prunus dulcis TaxID=3755 RepID=A0AAD4VWB0_PRUDU|nr:hypothetical protein L3X38_021765 [Prunus dulcis]